MIALLGLLLAVIVMFVPASRYRLSLLLLADNKVDGEPLIGDDKVPPAFA
jgi:hypothetical protein